MTPDAELISAYVSHRSEDAFRALMSRYVNLVYGACLRQLCDRHLAEDATQGVFVLLSQKAGSLHRQSCIAGWLLTTARYACANIRKVQQRRERRELVVAMNQESESSGAAADGAMLAELDEGLRRLGSSDRDALVLRFLQDRPLRDVGVALGVSEDAARKRVDRGLEKLRRYFLRREVATGEPTAMAVALVRHSQAVTLSAARSNELAAGVLSICHGGYAAGSAAVNIAQQIKAVMFMTHLKAAGAMAIVAIVLAVGGWFTSHAMAERTQTPVAVAVPPASPVAQAAAPTSAPATAPAVDLTTPEKTLEAFCTAMEHGDRAMVYACITADPNRPPTMVDVLLSATLAQNRFTRSVTAAFGKNEGFGLMVTLDQAGRMLQASAAMGGAAIVIDGDNATMTVQFAEIFIKALPADVQPDLRLWNGKGMRMVRDSAGNWRVDLDRTMRVVATIQTPQKSIGDPKVVQPVIEACTKALDELASDIANDQLTTYAQVRTAFGLKFWGTLKKFNGAIGYTVEVLPVEP